MMGAFCHWYFHFSLLVCWSYRMFHVKFSCCFVFTLITWITNSFMMWLYMLFQVRFPCCFMVITGIANSFMLWLYMLFQVRFSCCFIVTLITGSHLFHSGNIPWLVSANFLTYPSLCFHFCSCFDFIWVLKFDFWEIIFYTVHMVEISCWFVRKMS